jgi:peptidylprolyl isomerase
VNDANENDTNRAPLLRHPLVCPAVINFNAVSSLRSRAILGLAALAVVILIAGCGSSSSGESTIGVGEEHSSAETLAKAGAGSTASTGATSAPATTPTSGPLSKAPTVTPPSGPPPTTLVKKDLIVGTGAEAKAGDSISVNDIGILYKTGKQFESSFSRNEPFTLTLGSKMVIEGWENGIPGMKVGGRRELIIPSAEGYGTAGSPPKIPPNETLIFVIDLLSA